MASLSGWSEVAIFSVLFMVLAGIVVVNMNVAYNQNYDSTFNMGTNSTKSDLIDYQNTLKESIDKGEQTSSGLGLSLSTIWLMIKAGISMTWAFLTGQWIPNSIGLMGLGEAGIALATFLQILFVMSVGFLAIKIFMKVKP